jgi:hypothetical protein
MTTKDDNEEPTTYVELRPTKKFHEAIGYADLVYLGSVLLWLVIIGYLYGTVPAIGVTALLVTTTVWGYEHALERRGIEWRDV